MGDKIIFHRYGIKDHGSKACDAEVKCANCNKETHILIFVPDFTQKKAATLVGFGGEGLGCFVAEHAKDLSSGM